MQKNICEGFVELISGVSTELLSIYASIKYDSDHQLERQTLLGDTARTHSKSITTKCFINTIIKVPEIVIKQLGFSLCQKFSGASSRENAFTEEDCSNDLSNSIIGHSFVSNDHVE